MHRSSPPSHSAALCTSLCIGLFSLIPLTARAIGFDLIPPGAHEVGRGGASAVGADTAIGLFYNPATLLAPSTRSDTAVSLHMGFTDICYKGQAVLETGGMRSAGAQSPEICADTKPTFIPAIASTLRFGAQQRFALSLGFYAPPAVGRDVKYGDPVVGTVDGGANSALSPSRYMMMEQHLDQYFPTLGVAYQPARQLRLGASFGWGITTFDFTTATYSRVIASPAPLLVGGLSDVSNRVKGTDAFVPRVQVGLWAQPLASLPLELGASFTWTQEVESNGSTLRVRHLRTQYYSEPAAILGLLGTLAQPAIDARVENVSLNVPQVALLTTGLRYASKLHKPVGKKGDRLATERFDLEADFLVSFGKSLDRIVVGIPATTITIPSPTPAAADTQLMLPTENVIEHRWQTQLGLKLGGDYNVIPGMLALRVGYSYETDGISPGYHQLDFLPFERHGLYAGATVRLFDLLDLSAAYAHFVVPDVTNTVANAGLRRNVSGEPVPTDATISNAGTIAQDASALVVELAMHL